MNRITHTAFLFFNRAERLRADSGSDSSLVPWTVGASKSCHRSQSDAAWKGAVLSALAQAGEKKNHFCQEYFTEKRDVGSKSIIFFYENNCTFLQRASTLRIKFS